MKILIILILMDSIVHLQKAASIHNKTREFITPYIIENADIYNICNLIEQHINELSDSNELNGGIAFPTGISINNIAAHFTPNKNYDKLLNKSDVIKIDYGIHSNGYIIDSAFTINLDNKYNALLNASKESIETVIKNIGVGTHFSDLSEIIEEVAVSYEYDDNGTLKPIKIIDNLYGHNIKQWQIHAGKFLYPTVHKNDYQIVEDGEIMAIEVFVSNGDGITVIDENLNNYSHYNLKSEYMDNTIPLFSNKKLNILSNIIKNNYKTMPFCPRFINNNRKKFETYASITSLQQLFSCGIINSYPPLLETNPDSKIAQFEHTIYVSEETGVIDFNY
jgi:methionyl aminopeptidase